ncbi:MAG: methyltransferase domain-containing protein [Methylocystis sp.]|uniref:methyltransferase domain-containing protein n=1 Tax=Methylocystis sp. TaxID=1911079 RepID=UPI003D145DD0
MIRSKSPFGDHTQKYWDRRYDLFAKWDEGVETDAVGLFSVKPERFALEIGKLLEGDVILDAFCGIGGSAIGFARCGKRVIALDIDRDRLSMARRNAEIYGVSERIAFIHDDVTQAYPRLAFDAVHIDPPWGGPDYAKKERFGWEDFSPNPLPLVRRAISAGVAVAVGLPANFSKDALGELPAETVLRESRDATRVLFKTAYYPPVA